MTYFGFLLRFLFIPIALLAAWAWWDARRGKQIASPWRSWPAWSALLLHVVIAVVYTTPWDNYLVATRVWWYDPALVTGVVIGWVPIEEYTFFVVQPILAGLWLLTLLRYWGAGEQRVEKGTRIRYFSVGITAVLWLISIIILIVSWRPGTYLALELAWALPPIMLQLGFGADILWRYRHLVLAVLGPMTLYLSVADALAIGWGTWTIDPAQSLNVLLGGVLPIEEFVFFLLTNVLVTFGLTLLLSVDSRQRLTELRQKWAARKKALVIE